MKTTDVKSLPSKTLGLPKWMWLPFVMLASVTFAWHVFGVLVLWLLTVQVPLSAEDFASMEFFGQDSRDMRVSGLVVMTGVIALVLLVKGLFTRALWRYAYVALSLGLALLAGSPFTPGLGARIALLEGTARIGCFSPESAECKAKLGLPVGQAQSQWLTDGMPPLELKAVSKGLTPRGAQYQVWYLLPLKKALPPSAVVSATVLGTPFGAASLAPFHLASGERLRALVQRQQDEVAQLRKTASTP